MYRVMLYCELPSFVDDTLEVNVALYVPHKKMFKKTVRISVKGLSLLAILFDLQSLCVTFTAYFTKNVS